MRRRNRPHRPRHKTRAFDSTRKYHSYRCRAGGVVDRLISVVAGLVIAALVGINDAYGTGRVSIFDNVHAVGLVAMAKSREASVSVPVVIRDAPNENVIVGRLNFVESQRCVASLTKFGAGLDNALNVVLVQLHLKLTERLQFALVKALHVDDHADIARWELADVADSDVAHSVDSVYKLTDPEGFDAEISPQLLFRVATEQLIGFPISISAANRCICRGFRMSSSGNGGFGSISRSYEGSAQQFKRDAGGQETQYRSGSHDPLRAGIDPGEFAFRLGVLFGLGFPIVWFSAWWAGRDYGRTMLSFYGP